MGCLCESKTSFLKDSRTRAHHHIFLTSTFRTRGQKTFLPLISKNTKKEFLPICWVDGAEGEEGG